MVRRKTTLGTVIALTLLPVAAKAQTTFAVNKFEPAERGSEWFANESLDYRGKVRPAVGVTGDYAYRPMVVLNADGTVRDSVVRNALFVHAGASLTLFSRVRLGLNLPIQAAATGFASTVVRNGVTTYFPAPPKGGGLGDLRFGADARLYGEHQGPVRLALGAQAWAPTGSEEQYAGDGAWRIKPRFLAAGDIGRFTYAGQLAVTYRERDEKVGAGAIGSEINLGLAAGARLADGNLVVGPELWGSTVLSDAFGRKSTPAEVAVGAHYLLARAVRIGAGLGTGLNRSYGAPVSRALLAVEWIPEVIEDRDGDGIADREDACPDVRGIRSADPAKNGCPPPAPMPPAPPPPTDRDKDGILDGADACPDVPGVKTADPATNGCKDTDGDGIGDPKDACLDEAGLPNADPTLNGCPDEDGDGIFDKVDACPTIAGVADPDKQKNGCPANFDRDHDGINNNVDACPDDPGKPDPDPLKNGCPSAFVSAGQIKILEQVKFKPGSAQIDVKESLPILTAVAKVLKEHPEIKRVRIEGHTDKTGTPQANKKLSAERAAAVMKWLVANGVAQKRLTSAGFGSERPLDSNETEAGRQANRRVEFQIE